MTIKYSFQQIIILVALMFSLGCSTVSSSIPYRIDIDQGNEISIEDLDRLNIGMSKDEVIVILGEPLLQDIFHENQWDYVLYHKNGESKEVQEGIVTLYFTNGLLSNVERDSFITLEREPLMY